MGIQALTTGIKQRLMDAGVPAGVWNSYPPDHEIKFPIVIFFLENMQPDLYMGNKDDFRGQITFYISTEIKDGPAECRRIEQLVYDAMHKAPITADGYASVYTNVINRGNCENRSNMWYFITDTINIRGSEA